MDTGKLSRQLQILLTIVTLVCIILFFFKLVNNDIVMIFAGFTFCLIGVNDLIPSKKTYKSNKITAYLDILLGIVFIVFLLW